MDDNNVLKLYSDGENVYDSYDYERLSEEKKAELHEISGEEYRKKLGIDIPDNVPNAWNRSRPVNDEEGYYFKYICQSTKPK